MSAPTPAGAGGSGAFEGLGRVLMVGCGNMGGAMLSRWLEAGLDPSTVTVVSPSIRAMPPGVTAVRRFEGDWLPDTLVLAMKPQQLGAVAQDLATVPGAASLLVSILAGVDHATLFERFTADTIVRAMPNLPVRLGKGVVALHGVAVDAAVATRAERLMAPLGLVEWIDDEALFDVVTALSGSGPGFLYRVIDALTAGGAALGLPADQAARLALATVEGAAALAAEAELTPAMLADRVASPGGSTRAGLDALDRDAALVTLMTETLRAAARRNAELAAEARG